MAKSNVREKVAEGDAEEDKDKAKSDKDDKDEEKGEGDEGAEGGEGEAGEAAAPKKSKKKMIIIGAGALFLIIAGAAGAYFTGLFGKSEEESAVVMGPDGKPIEKPVFYTLPEFLVNLNSGGKQTSFLKATVILELQKSADVPLIEANLPRLIDSFNTYLREMRASDLAGSAGIQRLREELLLRANKGLAPVQINEVLFKEIIVQ